MLKTTGGLLAGAAIFTGTVTAYEEEHRLDIRQEYWPQGGSLQVEFIPGWVGDNTMPVEDIFMSHLGLSEYATFSDGHVLIDEEDYYRFARPHSVREISGNRYQLTFATESIDIGAAEEGEEAEMVLAFPGSEWAPDDAPEWFPGLEWAFARVFVVPNDRLSEDEEGRLNLLQESWPARGMLQAEFVTGFGSFNDPQAFHLGLSEYATYSDGYVIIEEVNYDKFAQPATARRVSENKWRLGFSTDSINMVAAEEGQDAEMVLAIPDPDHWDPSNPPTHYPDGYFDTIHFPLKPVMGDDVEEGCDPACVSE